jgi:hypothetical protein
MEAGQKIEAIKRYRERTGAGLKEAKDAVEGIGPGRTIPPDAPVDRDFEDEIISILGQGRKIEAIKLYREQTGAGLKASKEAVEALAERHGIITSQGGGCFGVVLVSLGFLTGVLACGDDRPTKLSKPQRAQNDRLVHAVSGACKNSPDLIERGYLKD